jgi:Rod binding domain-containing protein
MQIDPVQRPIRATDLPLEKLAANTRIGESEKLTEVSRQFEALLLRQILSEAHKTMFASNLMSDSAVSGIYQDMITSQLADQISRSGSLGLAGNLEKQMRVQLKPEEQNIASPQPVFTPGQDASERQGKRL